MADIPNDPVILLSFINTQLRDHYPSFEELCASLQADQALITKKLNDIGYFYHDSANQFQ